VTGPSATANGPGFGKGTGGSVGKNGETPPYRGNGYGPRKPFYLYRGYGGPPGVYPGGFF